MRGGGKSGVPGLRGFVMGGHTERGGGRALTPTSRSQLMTLERRKNRQKQELRDRERKRESKDRRQGGRQAQTAARLFLHSPEPPNPQGSLDPRVSGSCPKNGHQGRGHVPFCVGAAGLLFPLWLGSAGSAALPLSAPAVLSSQARVCTHVGAPRGC